MKSSLYIGIIALVLVILGGVALMKHTDTISSKTPGTELDGDGDYDGDPVAEASEPEEEEASEEDSSSEDQSVSAPTPAPVPAPTPAPTPEPTPAPSGYTMAQVAAHASASSCWTVVERNVYDLTSWISQHPGGKSAILRMCGKDGTQDFNDQHGGQARPERELASFLIGPLT